MAGPATPLPLKGRNDAARGRAERPGTGRNPRRWTQRRNDAARGRAERPAIKQLCADNSLAAMMPPADGRNDPWAGTAWGAIQAVPQ